MAVAPKYKFEIKVYNSAGTLLETRAVRPVWGDGFSREYVKESGEEFYRTALNGDITLVGPDYDWIMAHGIDRGYKLYIYISYDFGSMWGVYHVANFAFIDATIDSDHKTFVINSYTTDDAYAKILEGIDHEYNLLELAPTIEQIILSKRPVIQIYRAGDTVLGSVQNQLYWEEPCEAVTNANILTGTYHFNRILDQEYWTITDGVDAVAFGYYGDATNHFTISQGEGGFDIIFSNTEMGGTWEEQEVQDLTTPFWLSPMNSAAVAIGRVQVCLRSLTLYARFLTALSYWPGMGNTYPLTTDIVEISRNYPYALPYGNASSILLSTNLTSIPTKYGQNENGLYYAPPTGFVEEAVIPVGRSGWGGISAWFSLADIDWTVERNGRQTWVLRDTFPIWAVIKILLVKIAPGILHENSTVYSQFLYGTNPILDESFRVYISPKSNVLNSNYTQPAQRATITLRQVLDMLRDVFRCYWFIDDNYRFRIEHIEFFRNGGSYGGSHTVGSNLVAETNSRTGKSYAFGTSRYSYNKSEMSGRIEWSWSDEVSSIFVGTPIDIVSNYVDKSRTEKVAVRGFTSDVDLMLLYPSNFSKDGFALIAAMEQRTDENIFNSSTVRRQAQITSTGAIISGTTYDNWLVTGATAIGPNGITVMATGVTWRVGYFNFLDASGDIIATVAGADVTEGVEQGSGFKVRNPYGAVSVRMSISGLQDGLLNVIAIYPNKMVCPFKQFAYGYVQNGVLAFDYLYTCYLYDLSGWSAERAGNAVTVQGVKRLKKQQVTFPVSSDVNPEQLIRTGIGDGRVEKLSINLSSRQCSADLCFDIV